MLRMSLKHCRTEPDWPKGSLESQKMPNWDIVAKSYLRIKSVLTGVFQTCHPKQLDNDKLAALLKPLSFTGECSKQSHLRQELYKPHWMEHQYSSCIVEIQILTDVGQTLCSFTEERETRYFVWNSIKCLSAILYNMVLLPVKSGMKTAQTGEFFISCTSDRAQDTPKLPLHHLGASD